MENKEALETLKHQLACAKEEDCINDYCEHGPHDVSDTDFIEALTIAISALEKQEVDKCCETCKHKNRPVEESPCCDCYMSTAFDDSYEPYTEEEA